MPRYMPEHTSRRITDNPGFPDKWDIPTGKMPKPPKQRKKKPEEKKPKPKPEPDGTYRMTFRNPKPYRIKQPRAIGMAPRALPPGTGNALAESEQWVAYGDSAKRLGADRSPATRSPLRFDRANYGWSASQMQDVPVPPAAVRGRMSAQVEGSDRAAALGGPDQRAIGASRSRSNSPAHQDGSRPPMSVQSIGGRSPAVGGFSYRTKGGVTVNQGGRATTVRGDTIPLESGQSKPDVVVHAPGTAGPRYKGSDIFDQMQEGREANEAMQNARAAHEQQDNLGAQALHAQITGQGDESSRVRRRYR